MNIIESTDRYEKWLKKQLPTLGDKETINNELCEKHEKMAAGTFQFLRATYWRWAETILEICPDVKGAPSVLAVGDIHVENYGTWRDSEGRLVWGVNDFDEAARMPYVLDIVRLATSAVLAKAPNMTASAICSSIFTGYKEGLGSPEPYVLDRRHEWLRNKVIVTNAQRKKFWDKFLEANTEQSTIRPAYVKALESSRPDESISFDYQPRTAGTGSLGRPRWVGVGEWQGDLIVREAKAMVRSAWTLAHHGSHNLRCQEIAAGKYRCPDPWYHLRGRILVRRLSPNDYKIETKTKKKNEQKHKTLSPRELVNNQMLHAMGRDLASIHRGTPNRKKAIMADLDRREDGWLLAATTAVKSAIESEFREWRDAHRKTGASGAKRSAWPR